MHFNPKSPTSPTCQQRFKLLQTMNCQKKFICLQQAEALLKQYGSPLYVYKQELILRNIHELQRAAGNIHISYAMKANSHPEILKVIQNEGKGITNVDVVSPGEVYRALNCGYKPSQILYTENFISEEEIDYALSNDICINVGAVDTLKHFGPKLRGKDVFIRINPDHYGGAGQNQHVITAGDDSKFGICSNDLKQALEIASKNDIKIVGLHQHIGSNLKKKDKDIFIQTTKYIFETSKLFPDVKFINIGGGIGVKYRQQEELLDLEELYGEINKMRDEYNKELSVWIEPGRFIIANAGALLCKITARKQTKTHVFYGTDTGFNHLIRPNLYGAYHQITNLSGNTAPLEKSYVCGNICESCDNLGKDIMISGNIGDILCIENAGAYGFVMSMNYNERPRPAEVLILQDGSSKLIRRRETFEDLLPKI